ncbi:hypothetical protein [Paraburkholderia sp. MPAMCS5]|uniref:hypothetical protein n=1 Tax=Paraburkholderia sp. MPAMCS5 TaxID=3112563 RepID=UPI003FA6B9A7
MQFDPPSVNLVVGTLNRRNPPSVATFVFKSGAVLSSAPLWAMSIFSAMTNSSRKFDSSSV